MTKKKKANSGNPAKRASRHPTDSSIFSEAIILINKIQLPLHVFHTWEMISPRAFIESSDTQKGELTTALFRNPHTPAQVLWDLETAFRALDHPDYYKTFWKALEHRWSVTTQLPPILDSHDWRPDPTQLNFLVETLRRIVTKTEQPECISTAWEFTQEHLIQAEPSLLPGLIDAFESHPASPAEVIAGAMMQNALG